MNMIILTLCQQEQPYCLMSIWSVQVFVIPFPNLLFIVKCARPNEACSIISSQSWVKWRWGLTLSLSLCIVTTIMKIFHFIFNFCSKSICHHCWTRIQQSWRGELPLQRGWSYTGALKQKSIQLLGPSRHAAIKLYTVPGIWLDGCSFFHLLLVLKMKGGTILHFIFYVLTKRSIAKCHFRWLDLFHSQFHFYVVWNTFLNFPCFYMCMVSL